MPPLHQFKKKTVRVSHSREIMTHTSALMASGVTPPLGVFPFVWVGVVLIIISGVIRELEPGTPPVELLPLALLLSILRILNESSLSTSDPVAEGDGVSLGLLSTEIERFEVIMFWEGLRLSKGDCSPICSWFWLDMNKQFRYYTFLPWLGSRCVCLSFCVGL